ncbi:MAG: DUF1289 domain-containing protein [Ignavibacteriales bacterium]|nr:DUF1289 domain-containing protein [Ignavibacteriales bacterium]
MYKDDYVPSPCNNNCLVDFRTKLCSGCFRTIEEIIGWINFSATEKKQVLEKIQSRKELTPKHS